MVGKALEVYEYLADKTDYDEVKQVILTAYSTKGYWQTFKNSNKSSTLTYVELASEKSHAFHIWTKSAAVKTFDELVNLIVLEEFKRQVPYSIMVHLTFKEETPFQGN